MGKNNSSHHAFKDKAKNRVDDLQGMITDLQLARKESRTMDMAVLEDRVHEMLRDWKAELNEPSPTSSQNDCSLGSFSSSFCRFLQHCDAKNDATSALGPKHEPESNVLVGDAGTFNKDCSLGSLSSELRRLLQPHEENDDATSSLAQPLSQNPGQESDIEGLHAGYTGVFLQDYSVNEVSQEHGSQEVAHYIDSLPNKQYVIPNQLDHHQIDFHQEFSNVVFIGFNGTEPYQEDNIHHFSGLQPNLCPPSNAFLGPKCALWDCSRPAQQSDWGPDHCSNFHANLDRSPDYCDNFHANLAWKEGAPGSIPVQRPGGIGLKDGPLFSALSMKMQGKNVGIPECEGAATKKSPWNAPELFHITFFEGERIREWLFFDKPRKAFDRGNRKQRSLPDYNGRGWHASRKQAMKEHGGVKRSYYMDPQLSEHFEWHLYEYEIDKQDALTLYRLELKLLDEKKSPKGKITKDSLADLQKQMGRLTAEFPGDKEHYVKNGKVGNLGENAGNVS